MSDLIEVLIIDNDKYFATECVDFLQVMCNVGAVAALSAHEAEEHLKKFPIKIILLDYDMPLVNGLDLFPRLQQIDPYAQYVFISAVATNDVVYKSQKYPFAARIPKGTWYDELPELIPVLLMKYAKQFHTSNPVFYTERKRRWFRSHKVEYSICSYSIVNEEYIVPGSWHTTQMIRSGEKITHTEDVDYEKMFSFSDNFKLDTGLNFELTGADLAELKTALSMQLEESIQSNYTERIKVAINRIREISLSEIESGKDEAIVARYYDFANVYLEMKIRIKRHCTCCDTDTILLTTAYFPIPKVAYKIREYFDGKDPKTIDSGFYETGFSAAPLN